VIRIEDLARYLGGELDAAGDEAFERALFEAPGDPALALVDRLARIGACLAARGWRLARPRCAERASRAAASR
jgi:hypothetical protein